MEQAAKRSKIETGAKRPLARKGHKGKASEVRDIERRLAEAFAQHAAIAEILRVMSGSPGDVHPVLDAVAERAARLCESPYARVLLVDGDVLRPLAEYSLDGTPHARTVPLPLKRSSIAGRAVVDCATIHHDDVVPLLETEYPDAVNARRLGFRAVLGVPLMRERDAYGVIFLFRREPRSFSPEQIALVETFAQQAAIAIDNTRLFKETKEALEQQTATSEILRVIAGSPADVRPMLRAVVERAAKLCEAANATIFLAEGDKFLRPMAFTRSRRSSSAAHFGSAKRALELGQFIPLTRGSVAGRAIIERTTIHLEDLAAVPEEEYPIARAWQRVVRHRTLLAVPLMREDRAIGSLALFRMEVRPFTEKQIALVKTFADQAAIAIDNVRLFNETKEALERQTATSEILRVISQSPTDVQPVFDTIVTAALALCGATSANVVTFDGELIHMAAFAPATPEAAASLRRTYPRPPSRDTGNARAILTRSLVVIPDVLEDRDYAIGARAAASGYRSVVSVPLLREESPIGALTVARDQPGPFPEKQIALLRTFADQAVIAIENVRLFDEVQAHARDLSVSLQQQTATADVLKVISRSAFDLQTVLDTLTESACKLCEAKTSVVLRPDGNGFKAAATFGMSPMHKAAVEQLVVRPGRDTCSGRALLERKTVHIPDAAVDPDYNVPGVLDVTGNRAMLGVPMLRDGAPIGVLVLTRSVALPFTDKQIALATTFADQAAIAIENVRLFNETKEALEQQIATSEILRVISRSPRDVQPVFDTIAAAALSLCSASSAIVTTFDGEFVKLSALAKVDPEGAKAVRKSFPTRVGNGNASSRAVQSCSVVSIVDVLEDPDFTVKENAVKGGFRSVLAVPLIRNGAAIGTITVGRPSPGRLPEKQIALLQTFADQAVIAIENVRLFTELEARTAQLTRSVGELKALGEVGQAVSSTLDLETVLSTIVSRAVQLAGMDGGSIWEYDEAREQFYVHATDRLPDELVEVHRATPIRKGEGALGRLAMTGEPVEIRDIADESSYPSRLREILIRCGYRSVLAVPLLRENHLLGALAVSRTAPGEFAPEAIALLKTFATQSALAIQNARLYREIEVKSKELEAASRHKSEFLANMSHELRTPLNAIIGFSEVLSERMFGEINEKQAEYIGDILQSGQHLLSLINDILDLSKVEAGRMELELSDFDLPSIIENTLILVRERAVRRSIALRREIDERLGVIRADERKVKQVLLNLLSNALKFTPEGGQISVRAAIQDGVAEISVTDTGVGIAPDDQEMVFEEFRQVRTASKTVEGTGLGLAISRKFIELHGGRIWVNSQLGAGSTFTFTLPLKIESRDQIS